jgi:hypothetical protein
MMPETTATPCEPGCGHVNIHVGWIRQGVPTDCPACGSIDYAGDGRMPSRDRWLDERTTLVTCPECGHRWTVGHPIP